MDELTGVATHTNYQHRNHLRIEGGEECLRWNAIDGFSKERAVCVAPSHSRYAKLNRKGLPCHHCGTARDCRMCKNG